MTHIFAQEILRAYDIRGRFGDNLTEKDAFALGRSFVEFLNIKSPKIYVGYDGRVHSPILAEALIDGLVCAGAQVINIGLGPTPMLYFSVRDGRGDGGIMITGSHNPPQDNGFKMMRAKAPVFGDDIQKIGKIAASLCDADAAEKGGKAELDIKEKYIDRLLKDLDCNQNLNIAWDAGNGAAGAVLKDLTNKIAGNHTLLFDDVDGNFPNHHPDPTVDENLADLQRAVKDNACDIGIAFDGDGDRIGVVDENGAVIRGDMLLAIYAKEVLEDNPNAPIIADVKCSNVLFDEIKKSGGRPVMAATGHSIIKSKMAQLNAPLAGELSGHIFFADKYYGFDDALYCAIRLINIVARAGKLSSLTEPLPKMHSTPELRIEVPEEKKFRIVKLASKFLENSSADVDTTDGVRVTTKDGWWLLRASNTSAALVARAESDTKDGLDRLKAMIDEQISNHA